MCDELKKNNNGYNNIIFYIMIFKIDKWIVIIYSIPRKNTISNRYNINSLFQLLSSFFNIGHHDSRSLVPELCELQFSSTQWKARVSSFQTQWIPCHELQHPSRPVG